MGTRWQNTLFAAAEPTSEAVSRIAFFAQRALGFLMKITRPNFLI
jgi:hypothetical protein